MTNRSQEHAYAVALARAAVSELAPGELPMFGAAADAFDARAYRRSQADTTLGFGVGDAAAFLSPVVLLAASKAVEYALSQVESAATAAAHGLLKRAWVKLMRRLGYGAKPSATIPALSTEQLARARAVMLEALDGYRVLDEDRGRMADVLIGRLALMAQQPANP